MQSLSEVYASLQAKKKEKKELTKMFADALTHNGEYQKILEDLKLLKEKKKAIENQAKAEALSEAQQLDDLKEDIKSHSELLSDIAITKFVNRENIEIQDEVADTRLVPVFSVKYKKEEGESYQAKAEAERADDHVDRMFAPAAIMQGVVNEDESEGEGEAPAEEEQTEEVEKVEESHFAPHFRGK